MTQEELKRLRSYYHSLIQLQTMLSQNARSNVDAGTSKIVIQEIDSLGRQFPGLLPEFDFKEHVWDPTIGTYHWSGLLSILAVAVGRLEIAIEESKGLPVTETRDFTFVKNTELRQLIERDYEEAQKNYVNGCWKSAIIIAGSTIEAILTDLLLQHEAKAKTAKKAPKDRKGVRDWGLVHLILVAVELGLVTPGVEKLSHSIREYRDLVHPAVEVRTKLKGDKEEARIALEVLNMLHRDLSK